MVVGGSAVVAAAERVAGAVGELAAAAVCDLAEPDASRVHATLRKAEPVKLSV